MPAHPLEYAPPTGGRGFRWIAGRFSRGHLWIAVALWVGFSALTLVILLAALRSEPGRALKIAVTTAATVLGPMTGAICRDFQKCCLEASLGLLPYCLCGPAFAVAVQLAVPPPGAWLRAGRLLAWAAGLIVWFGGGIVSFLHALS